MTNQVLNFQCRSNLKRPKKIIIAPVQYDSVTRHKINSFTVRGKEELVLPFFYLQFKGKQSVIKNEYIQQQKKDNSFYFLLKA